MRRVSRRAALALPFVGYLMARASARAQTAARPGPPARGPHAKDVEWRSFAGDLANTRYSPLDQINAANFNDLEVAWRFKTDAFGARPEYQFESTPLMIGGVIYTTAGSRRDVVALDAATGEILWMHREDEGQRAEVAPRKLSGRGLAYWTDGVEGRILYVTIGYQLVALDAKSGLPVPGFGVNGVVDLKQDDDQDIDPILSDIGLHATPCVAKDVVIIGAAHSVGNIPKTFKNTKGYVRGFDVRTGKRLWIFHTIPKKGEFGYDTWLDGTENIGSGGVWCQISVDEELNLAYLGVELPTGDEEGGHRRGDALFGESLVAVDLHTGERRWHYQMVHHGLWDYDTCCAAILVDIPVRGKIVKALAQPSKQSFLYVLNRETGKPIWPIPEKRVPKGDVPGEWYSPTQPHPSKPPAYDVQGIDPSVLIDYTPELHAQALKLIANYRIGPIFTPPTVYHPEGSWGTLTAPNLTGGTNWAGGSYDPEHHIVYVYSKTQADVMMAVKNTDPAESDFDYVNMRAAPRAPGKPPERDGFRPGLLTVQGLPLLKPPYGRITAIDLTKGDIAWQIAHGETPDEIRNHPALKGVKIPRTGRAGSLIGPLTTKTLVVCGEAGFVTTPSGARGAMLRAYDKATGEEKGAVYLPAPQSGAPMTYMLGGAQYIVLAIGGGNYSGELVAFRLPRG
ncbi:PQQ-binding-like beta-propeller repeat protein [Phenylobacterium hankyongense]|nr:PQQ-binding-like beta-propeller repeat protein [Phenylobacterium hankyongense]